MNIDSQNQNLNYITDGSNSVKLTNKNNESKVTFLGETHFRGQSKKFGIKREDRTRHTYIIGKTGMGKSTMLENMAIQDIQNGEGLCFIDPHGSSAEKLLSYIPESRIQDVIYFNPSDLKFPIGLNVLEYADEKSRHLISSGLMNTLKKIFEDQFSGRMIYLLQNAILAILENEGESLLGINRIFTDKQYRKKILSNVKDPVVLNYWEDEFAKYTDKYIQEAVPAIQNKIGQFISNPLIRNIIGQKTNSFDIRDIMDKKKILICNLSVGLIGEDNVNLIGSLLVTKIYLAALSRSNLSYEELPKAAPFYLYVDEFQNFVNESFAQILSQARKYNLGLIVANQYIDQLDDNTRSAIFGNVGTMITFRVGASDAEALEKEFQPTFMAEDIVNLYRFEILLRMSIDGVSSAPFSALSMSPIKRKDRDLSLATIALSRAVYGKSKDYVEQDIIEWYKKDNVSNFNKSPIITKSIVSDNPSNIVTSNKKPDSHYSSLSKYKKEDNQNQNSNIEANKKDLQKIREKQIQNSYIYSDPVYDSLVQKNNNTKSPDFINYNQDQNRQKTKETLSELFLKASNNTSQNYSFNSEQKTHNNKTQTQKNNFVLRDAIAKAMMVNIDNKNSHTNNNHSKVTKESSNKEDSKLNTVLQDNPFSGVVLDQNFNKEQTAVVKEINNQTQNVIKKEKLDKNDNNQNKHYQDSNKSNLKINDIRKEFLEDYPEDPDIYFIEKLLKGEE